MDTDGFSLLNYKNRARITDAVSRGLTVPVRDLQLEDTGTYWVGIDKIYADIMLRIQVIVRNGKTAFIMLKTKEQTES